MGGNASDKIIDDFVAKMIADKGVELDEIAYVEERDRLANELSKLLEDTTIATLPEEKAQKLDRLIKEKGEDLTENEVFAVFYAEQGSINEAVAKAMAEFREKYLREDENA